MKGGKKGRKTIRLPQLGKLDRKGDDNGPTSPVDTTQHLVLENPENGPECPKPVQLKGFCRKKNPKKTTKIRKSPKACVTLARRKVGKKVLQGRKRKLQCLYSVTSSEYSFTDNLKPSDGSSYSPNYRNLNSNDRDDQSSILDDGSEYYYTVNSKDASHESGSSSYYDSDSEASTRKGVAWDVPNRQPGAEQWYPEYDPKILGKGSFATVYLSYSKASKRYFAVKCANGGRPSVLKSLTREADILKKLNSPYVIEYLGECRVPVTLKPSRSGIRPKPVPMVTEIYLPYMKKGTLADEIRSCLRKKRTMKESLIRNYNTQILRGLSYLHSKNIVHCDLKGSNILVGKTHLKISDFGCSKHVVPNQNRRLISRAGTRAWMAPEVRMRTEQGFPADVWSLGCTVVQMITGKPPVGKLLSFLESNTTSAPPAIIPELEGLSSECISFLGKCFLKDPKARWTCQQLLEHPFLKAK